MLILSGSAIVNEAILTGESTPQWKVSISGRSTEEKLSARRDKTTFFLEGRKYCSTPQISCLQIGFETSQGKLMRTILFSTEGYSQ